MTDRAADDAKVVDDWIKYGSVSGLVFVVLFMSAAVLPLPDTISTIAALIMPGFLVLGHIGLYQFLNRHRSAFTNQVAAIFGICAPVLVSAMITVQLSMQWYMTKYYAPLDEATKAAQINIWRAVDSVQLGLDVAWDMFILPTVMLFAWGLMKHPAFGKVFGGIGLVLGLVGLVLNVATFPTPPINAGLIDVGPFVVTWYGVMFALLIRAHRKAG